MGNASLNNRGFTLIEVLVSIVILTVGLLGLLQAVTVSMEHNLRNQMRVQGTIMADTEMAGEMAKGFAKADTSKLAVSRPWPVMAAMRNYSVFRNGTSAGTYKIVKYRTTWGYRGQRYSHSITSVISQK